MPTEKELKEKLDADIAAVLAGAGVEGTPYNVQAAIEALKATASQQAKVAMKAKALAANAVKIAAKAKVLNAKAKRWNDCYPS